MRRAHERIGFLADLRTQEFLHWRGYSVLTPLFDTGSHEDAGAEMFVTRRWSLHHRTDHGQNVGDPRPLYFPFILVPPLHLGSGPTRPLHPRARRRLSPRGPRPPAGRGAPRGHQGEPRGRETRRGRREGPAGCGRVSPGLCGRRHGACAAEGPWGSQRGYPCRAGDWRSSRVVRSQAVEGRRYFLWSSRVSQPFGVLWPVSGTWNTSGRFLAGLLCTSGVFLSLVWCRLGNCIVALKDEADVEVFIEGRSCQDAARQTLSWLAGPGAAGL